MLLLEVGLILLSLQLLQLGLLLYLLQLVLLLQLPIATSAAWASLGYVWSLLQLLQLAVLLQIGLLLYLLQLLQLGPAWATFVPVATSATCRTSANWANFVFPATSATCATFVLLLSCCNFCNFQLALILELRLLLYLLQLVQPVLLLQLGLLLYLLQLLQLALLL